MRTFIYLLLVAEISEDPDLRKQGRHSGNAVESAWGPSIAFLDALHQTTFFSSLDMSVHFGENDSKSCCERKSEEVRNDVTDGRTIGAVYIPP